MWLIILSLSPYNMHPLFCHVLSIWCFTYLVLMALFFPTIGKESVSLKWFPFLKLVQVFSWDISFVGRLKSPYCSFFIQLLFSGYFWSSDVFLSVLFLVDRNSFPSRFFMHSSSRCIDASTLSWMIANPLHTFFFLTHTVRVCQILCIKMGFRVLGSICRRSSLVPIKNGSDILTRLTALEFIPFH